MAFTRINGNVTHFRAEGRDGAPAIVFINSLGSDLRIWGEIAPAFVERMHVIRYDKRGYGLSDLGSPEISIDDYAADLLALLETLNVKRVTVVGISLGGMIAQRLAAQCPETVAALILCATAAQIGKREMWDARIAAIRQSGVEGIADGAIDRWFSSAFRKTRRTDVAGWRNMLVRTPVEGYIAGCIATRDADLTEAASRIRAPTLCIAGGEDTATPPDLVRATASLIPGARFEVIQGAGHLPCIEQPARLVELIAAHLKDDCIV